MLSPVPNSRRALAAQASKLSPAGARNDDIGFLRYAVLEYASALEHEAARFACNVPDDPLEADECGRAVAAVHPQVLDVPLQGHNTPLPSERSPPASFKRTSESAKRKRAHGVVGPWRGPADPEGRWPPPPTDFRLDGERSSRASSCAHGTRASVRRRWPPRVTGESRDYATDATA